MSAPALHRWIALIALCAAPAGISVADDAAPGDPGALSGTWLVESARLNGLNNLSLVWRSKLTVTGHSFALSKFWGVSKDLTGTFSLGGPTGPASIDLNVSEFDLAEIGSAFKYPACALPGIYRTDGERLTVCFPTGPDPKRPTNFQPTDRTSVVLTLVRPRAGFKDFPDGVTVRVVDPDGRPAAGAEVFEMMTRDVDPTKPEAPPAWKYLELAETGADGVARVKYDALASCPAAARDPARGLIGLAPVSPASLQAGSVTVTLAPECRVSGTLHCRELAGAGKPIGWTNVMLSYDGRQVGMCRSLSGEFEFRVPPGEYSLMAYGRELPRKKVALTVPARRSELRVPPIELTVSPLVALQGRPAPELEGIVGWKGTPTRLADLRGKVVLLDFWGYWCGPCVAEMPTLIDLHERFKDKGLAVVGVHVDDYGEVDTAAKLDERLVGIRKRLWAGRDVPFSVALISGKEVSGPDGTTYRAGAAAQYGVVSYPKTIVIGRDGKVVGEFSAHDAKEAAAEAEKLLGPGPRK